MYIPTAFENNNIEQLHQFIERFNFATLISNRNGEISVTHVPVLLNRDIGPYGTLIWHVANLNPHTIKFNEAHNVLFIFHGPHAYISPAWYKTSPSVPTWNYAVVHAHGVPEVISKKQLSDDLTEMVNHHELLIEGPNYTIPQDYKLKLLEHITGFRMEISRIEGKFKLGQNRSGADQNGMLQALRKQNKPESLALADFIESINGAKVTK